MTVKRFVSVHGETFNMMHEGNLAIAPHRQCLITVTPRQVCIHTKKGDFLVQLDGDVKEGEADKITKEFQKVVDQILEKGGA
jgi:hypothetical protein